MTFIQSSLAVPYGPAQVSDNANTASVWFTTKVESAVWKLKNNGRFDVSWVNENGGVFISLAQSTVQMLTRFAVATVPARLVWSPAQNNFLIISYENLPAFNAHYGIDYIDVVSQILTFFTCRSDFCCVQEMSFVPVNGKFSDYFKN